MAAALFIGGKGQLVKYMAERKLPPWHKDPESALGGLISNFVSLYLGGKRIRWCFFKIHHLRYQTNIHFEE
jgi:hypothetical protein